MQFHVQSVSYVWSYLYALADSEGGGRDVHPPPKKTPKKRKKTEREREGEREREREREREERFFLFASNYHNNLQVYLNFPA